MTDQNLETYRFDNDLTLVVERMEYVQSASFALLVPAGGIYDPAGQTGSACVLSDLITRGAGDRNTKELAADLENLGVHHSESPSAAHMGFSAATLAANLPAVLPIYGDVIRRPHLPPDQFDAARSGVEQALRAMEDEPRQKIMQELRQRCYDAPWGRPTEGRLDELPNLTAQAVREHYDRCFRPNGSILGVAGNVQPDEIRDLVGEVFDDWEKKPDPHFDTGGRGPRRDHIDHDSTQTHIGIGYNAVPYCDDDYYAAWAAVSILSGGMSSRLFTEVREKRGLCYAVFASLSSLKHEGRVLCYAGTTSERAQETLDVTVSELSRLGEGVEQAELSRCQARAKSSLVMQQESTMSRAGSIARDWYHLKRVTTLDEVRGKIDALTTSTVLDYVRRYPADDFTVLTIGPEALTS